MFSTETLWHVSFFNLGYKTIQDGHVKLALFSLLTLSSFILLSVLQAWGHLVGCIELEMSPIKHT